MRSELGGWAPRYALSDGTMDVDPDRLWQVRGGAWEEPHPLTCPNGDPLGAGRTLVGWQACPAVTDLGGHRLHICRECGAEIYTPAATEHCEHGAFDSR